MELGIIIAIIILGILLCVWNGHKFGTNKKTCLTAIRKQPNVDSFNDSIAQAKAIGKAIYNRAFILGNPSLSANFKGYKKTYHFSAFDSEDYRTEKTEAFLQGNSVDLIKFCRLCHSNGISIRLRQIGLKDTGHPKTEKNKFVSKPEPTLFLKNE